jgi:hypothetical protein
MNIISGKPKKICSCKSCNNKAIIELPIKFVGVTSWFCRSCAKELRELDIVDQKGEI